MIVEKTLQDKELREKIFRALKEERCQYYYDISSNISNLSVSYNKRHFVSINEQKEIIGYFSFHEHSNKEIEELSVISFDKRNLGFLIEVKNFFYNCFIKNTYNSIKWKSFKDNPFINGYIKLCKRYGGNIKELKDFVLGLDGEFHQVVEFQILKEDIRRHIKCRKNL